MNIITLFRFITTHPLNRRSKSAAVGRFVRWQVASRLLGAQVALPFVNDTRLLARRGTTGATGNWYCGLHEAAEMAFVLHALRPDDLFMDVGANIGSYTVLAPGGGGAQTICVEPIESTFAHLMDNINLNGLGGKVDAHRCGVSNREGELRFTGDLDTMNRVVGEDEKIASVAVPVHTIDTLCGDRRPAVIKIDVEGHESMALAGGAKVLGDPKVLAVMMETNGSGSRVGNLIATMRGFGFEECYYNPVARVLLPTPESTNNTIFVKDRALVTERCRTSPVYTLCNGRI